MYNDQADRYAIEVGGIGDELMTFISNEDKALVEKMLLRSEDLKHFTFPNPDVLKRATVMLGKAPGQIRQTVQSLGNKDPENLVRVMITAVALANMASQAIRKERQFEYVVGRGYREAARYVAENVMNRAEELSKNIETVLERAISRDLVNRARSAAATGKHPAAPSRDDQDDDLVNRIRKGLELQLTHARSSCRQVLQPGSGFSDETRKHYELLLETSQRVVEDFEELSGRMKVDARPNDDPSNILG